MSIRKLLTYEVAVSVAIWLLWFPITSVGPADRPELGAEIPKFYSLDSLISSADSLIEKAKTGHVPDSNKIKFNHILNTLK